MSARRANSARSLHRYDSRPRSSYNSNFESQRKKGLQELKNELNERSDHKGFNSERPETAPMFTRSVKKLIIPQSGRPKLEK